MKKILIFGLFLLFAAEAKAFTCYDGFELKTYPDGTKYCQRDEKAQGYFRYPACDQAGSGVWLVLHNGKCYQCPANCAECDDSGVCTKCESGYVLKNGACAVKPKTQIAFCPPDKTLSDDLCCCISK